MIPMNEMTESPKKTVRWPKRSMDGPAIKHPMNLPIKAREDMSEV